MYHKLLLLTVLLNLLTLNTAEAEEFDHSSWNALLNAHVVVINDGNSTAVDYQGMHDDRAKLAQYLQSMSEIEQEDFDVWTANEQLAFLINAYNAWTVELILTAWPDIKSIKDLGNFLSSPWKKSFIPLLGDIRSLDDIEHKMIRGSGRYNDPRIHFAVNCASIGCPSLLPAAYTSDRLDEQLNDQTIQFLGDRSRNRADDIKIELSPVFKWYRADFEQGWQDHQRLEDFLLAYADVLGLSDEMTAKLKTHKANIRFLKYDWDLNKTR